MSSSPPITGRLTLTADDLELIQREESGLKFEDLTDDEKIIATRRKFLHDLIHSLQDRSLVYKASGSIPPRRLYIRRDYLIPFVDAVVKEFQHIEFKNYLREECQIIKHDSSPDVIIETLLQGRVLEHRFSKFSQWAIWKAINEIIREVVNKHKAVKLNELRNILPRVKSINWDSSFSDDLKELEKHKFSGLNSEEKEKEIWAYKSFLFGWRTIRVPHDPHPPKDVIPNLVKKTLEEDYVMDPNPETEFEKIDRCASGYYFLSHGRRAYQDWYYTNQSVIVRLENVSLDVSTKTIEEFFGSQQHPVVQVAMISGDESQTAFVTFKLQRSIESVLHLKHIEMENKTVKITSINAFKAGSETTVKKVDGDNVSNVLELLNNYWFYTQSH